jgi:uncharacterized membrane protein
VENPVLQFSLDPEGVPVSDPTSYQPPPPPPPQFQAPPPAGTGLSDNAASGLAYITFIPAIIFLVVPPYNQSVNVRFHSWQSIFLSIAWFAVWVVLVIVGMIPFVNFLDVILFPLVGIGFLILWIIVLINAFQGKRFMIPVIGPLAAKQAGGLGI